MRRMRPAGFGIDHDLAIAVIGGDDHRPTGSLKRLKHPAQAAIHRLAGGDRGVQIAGMADHV
ncbi:hypothetical protein LCGC14_2352400, partial [marine sediment metagenome]